MKLELIDDLYAELLMEAFEGEKQMLRILPRIQQNVTTEEIRDALAEHIKTTEQQATRLEKLLKVNAPQVRKEPTAMAGLLADAEQLLNRGIEDPELLEIALLAAAQKVEAFESACYGSLVTLSKLSKKRSDAQVLEQIWKEERFMHDRLAAFLEALEMEAVEAETPVGAARS